MYHLNNSLYIFILPSVCLNKGDRLTNYNGTALTYDNIGNPLTYYTGQSYTFTWKGRELTGATYGGKTMSFTYNDNGIRTSKTVAGTKTTYYLDGDRIVAEETNGNVIVYIYDENWQPLGMQYHSAINDADDWYVYWFEKNIFGDVVAVYNQGGIKMASYVYDAWGNATVTYSNDGDILPSKFNPFRYRGYYFDKELNLYYVNSRYYDAKICRWISPDAIELITSTPMSLSDNNLYAYCDNNPVNRVDYSGEIWHPAVIGAFVGMLGGLAGQGITDALTSVLCNELTVSNWETYAGAAIGGAAGGVILGGTGNIGASNFASGFISTGAGMFLEKLFGDFTKNME